MSTGGHLTAVPDLPEKVKGSDGKVYPSRQRRAIKTGPVDDERRHECSQCGMVYNRDGSDDGSSCRCPEPEASPAVTHPAVDREPMIACLRALGRMVEATKGADPRALELLPLDELRIPEYLARCRRLERWLHVLIARFEGAK